ncbi:hypothetical protein LVD15_22635 [Fulvivirga maritima]|uniref:hypothetical protein n=1 Tax=Fulvivirga maritima TaxID=2904247 RepID=UPI001F3D7BD1|nr:hypothetical protein [Fulvivirga maritima]UII26071.1 hypothetical protein LVD15_22635 [Fulvivirga maritima]
MKINWLVILLLVFSCSSENVSYEQVLFSAVGVTSDEKDYYNSLEEAKGFGLLLSLDSVKSMHSLKAIVDEKYCDNIVSVHLSEISKNAYLPIAYWCNAIININYNDVAIIKAIDDVKGATNKNEPIVIETSSLDINNLKKVLNEIARDYKSTLESKMGKPIEDLSLAERIEIQEKWPLTVLMI